MAAGEHQRRVERVRAFEPGHYGAALARRARKSGRNRSASRLRPKPSGSETPATRRKTTARARRHGGTSARPLKRGGTGSRGIAAIVLLKLAAGTAG